MSFVETSPKTLLCYYMYDFIVMHSYTPPALLGNSFRSLGKNNSKSFKYDRNQITRSYRVLCFNCPEFAAFATSIGEGTIQLSTLRLRHLGIRTQVFNLMESTIQL